MIDDGQNVTVFLNGWERLYADVRLTVRPMLFRDTQALKRKARAGKDFDLLMAAECEKRILEWDFKGKVGKEQDEPLAITSVNILNQCPSPLIERLFDVVSGYSGGDADPEASEHEATEFAQLQESAEVNGTSTGIEREEADAKN